MTCSMAGLQDTGHAAVHAMHSSVAVKLTRVSANACTTTSCYLCGTQPELAPGQCRKSHPQKLPLLPTLIMHATMTSVQLSLVATLNSVSAAVQKRSKLVCSFKPLQAAAAAAQGPRHSQQPHHVLRRSEFYAFLAQDKQ